MIGRCLIGLSPHQRRLWDYIARHVRERGQAPTYGMIQRDLGFNSRGHVSDMLKRLERAGQLRRPGRPYESIELTAEIAGQRYRFIPKTRAA